MATLTDGITMLYCPKCQRKYEKGSQRFCNNDGGRLLPAVNSGANRENQSRGVFTNLLAQTASRFEADEKLAPKPRFISARNVAPSINKTSPGKVYTAEKDLNLPAEKKVSEPPQKVPAAPKKETPAAPKRGARVITQKDVKIGRAELGDRTIKPAGRPAVTWQNPRILLGQTVKGRYFISQKLDQDSTGIAYLAKDKLRQGKNVVIRVLMGQDVKEGFQHKLLTEERVSLAHIDHPNVCRVFDSGELPEGKPFIATEFIEGESVKEYLKKTGVFNQQRTARIIRQASLALSEVHQNGILHRNLQPQHLLLTVAEAGNEIVKVTEFCVSDGKVTKENFLYKSPEQITGQPPTFASDSFSLAVIAYQMLTNRLPFNPATERELLKSQKLGPIIEASTLTANLNPLVDEILSKALAFDASDRYPKARDFGEAFYNVLTTTAPWENEPKKEPVKLKTASEPRPPKREIPSPVIPAAGLPEFNSENETHVSSFEDETHFSFEPNEINSDIHIDSSATLREDAEPDDLQFDFETEAPENKKASATKDSLWEKRSPEPVKDRGSYWILFPIFGLVILCLGVFGIWQYFSGLDDARPELPTEKISSKNIPPQGVDSEEKTNAKLNEEIESPPLPRNIKTPPGFKYFENSVQNLSPELARDFRGFSLSYPGEWKLKKFDKNRDIVDDKFLDIARESSGGIPIESLMISPYDSNGTFNQDKKLFPNLVERSNRDLSKSLDGNYEVVTEGETSIQNGRWRAYQVNFRTKEKGEVNGKQIELWGRRLWIPVQRPGVKNGFIITMFATSLSDEIKGADDVGKKGELASILDTFEPDQNY